MKDELYRYLKTKKDFVSYEAIEDALHISTTEDKDEIGKAIDALEKDYKLYVSKNHQYILYEISKNLRAGELSVNKKGDGYVKVFNMSNESDIFVPRDELKYSLDGDIVAVEMVEFDGKDDKRFRPKDPEKRSGKVIKILDRDLSNIVGEIVKGEDGLEFKSLDKRDATFILDEEELTGCVEGEIVVLEAVNNLGKNQFTATIKDKLGHKDDAGMDIKIICAKHEVYDEFPQDVIEELDTIPDAIDDKDRVGRVDLTDKMIFTIDGKDTKDVDDAISLEMSEDGKYFILGVHIADVSNYVLEGSPLDVEALNRGTSCYPPGSVIPMLPHKLSNGICSLNEDVDRCAVTCEMKIGRDGLVKGFDIYPSIIHSKKKMNYDDVNSIIEKDIVPAGYEPFAQTLKDMQELAHIIRHERENRGASDFDIKEPKVVCDLDGTPTEIVARDRGEGERLIEDFMIAANETVARSIYYNHQFGRQLPGVYRVHEFPLETKIKKFISFISSIGHPIKGDVKKIDYRTISNLLKQITFKNETEESIIKSMAVRSMPKAFYSEQNLGHYGLASKCYTHFTSPIRRYSDLQLHRLLREFFFNNNVEDRTIDRFESLLPKVCKHISDREVKAAEAERECVSMKMAEYMENYIKEHPDEEYTATVTGVTSFGIFVQLPNLVEGMIPLSSLDGYYTFDEESQSLSSKGKAPIMLGAEFKVKCVGASKAEAQVTFEIVKELENKKNNNNAKEKKLVKNNGRN